MIELTERQKEVFDVIKNFINKNGYSPSIREIAELSGLRSPATVHYYLLILSRKGYIQYEHNKNRTITIREENDK